MKHEEILVQPRLTPEGARRYARSMPDHIEIQEPSSGVSHASHESSSPGKSPEEVFKELQAKGDQTYKEQIQKLQQAHQEAAQQAGGKDEEKEEPEADKTTADEAARDVKDTSDTKVDLTEDSPKSSLWGAILGAVKGSLRDEKLVKRVDAFTKSYDSLKNANLNQIMQEYQAWTPPDNKNDPQKVVYIVVQKYIAQLVEDKGEVPLAVFLQAANENRNINVQELLSESTTGASAGVEKAMQRLMVALDEKDIHEWDTHDLAEELVAFKQVVEADGGANAIDKQVVQAVEGFVIDKVEESGVTTEAFDRVVTQVEEEREDTVLAQVPVQAAPAEEAVVARGEDRLVNVKSTPAQGSTSPQEDHIIEVKPTTHDTVHSFKKEDTIPLPEKMSHGNDPELARAMWRAYNRGKELTTEQQLLASRGHMPMIMGGSALPKEEERPRLHVLPPAGKVVPIRQEAHRVDDEEEENEDERPSNVIQFRPKGESSAPTTLVSEVSEDAYSGWVGGSSDGIDVEDTKAKIGKDWGDLEAFFKSKADGALGLVFDKAKRDSAQQQQIAAYFESQRAEALALKKEGKLEEAQKIAAKLVDQLNGAYNELDQERRMRIPEGNFNARVDGDRWDWIERNKTGYYNPTSMNELAYIIGLEEQQFAPGGERQMIDEDGNFYEENFMYWVQDRFLTWHNNDPDNPQRFFDLIKVEHQEMFRDVSVNTLVNNKDKFLKIKMVDEDRSVRDPANPRNEKLVYKYVPLDELHAYLTDFVWLVGSIRNASAEYTLQMSDDNKIGELIAAVMKSNVLTKRSAGKENTMEAVATLTSNFRDWGNIPRLVSEVAKLPGGRIFDQDDIKLNENARLKVLGDPNPASPGYAGRKAEYDRIERETKEFLSYVEQIKAEKQNIDVGDGVAVAYLIYYNIADYDYLERKFGGNETHLFKKQGMDAVLDRVAKVTTDEKEAARAGNDTDRMLRLADYLARAALISPLEDKKDHEKIAAARKWFSDWYDGSGNLKKDKRAAFMTMLNIFVPPQKNPNQNDMANRLIQLVVGERLALHKPPDPRNPNPTTEQKLATVMGDAYNEFAMLIAQFMTPFTGAAAKNDIGVNAVNAAAKMRWIDFYKKKQGENTRAGGWGNLYNLGTIRSSYVDMMVGMPTVNGKSILSIFEEKDEALRKNADFNTRSQISRQLLLNLNDAKQYGAAHTGNAIKIFHQEIEGKEIDFHKFIHVDPLTGHISYKPDAMLEALQDAIIKPTRYAWSTNRVPFHYIVRIMEDNKKEPPVFRTGTQLEDMFKPKVLKVIEKTYLTSNKNNRNIPAYVRREGFLNPDGTVRRYAANSEGQLINKQGKVITIPKDVKAPTQEEHESKAAFQKRYNDWDKEMERFHSELVLDPSDEGVMDPVMATLWNDTSFRRCVVKGYLVNRFAGQLFGHTSKHSPYEYLEYGLREDIIQGLAHIPVDPEDHTGEFEDKHIGNYYFTKEDIQMLRNLSRNNLWWNGTWFGFIPRPGNVLLALGSDLRRGLFDAFKEYFSRIMKASTAGVG